MMTETQITYGVIMKPTSVLLVVSLFIAGPVFADLPTALKDKIKQGSGHIDVLEDVSALELANYLSSSGGLTLGVDLNEATNGLESWDSVGVAIKDITLSLQTTAGSYSFSDFYTNTTANILDAATGVASDFYTLFGSAGSNQINNSTTDFSGVDDVISIDNVAFEGGILSAGLDISFVDTSGSGSNETFFDYSAGGEKFAIILASEGAAADAASPAVANAPAAISFSVAGPTGTPEPWWFLGLLIPIIHWLRKSPARVVS
jgi:hypothetical protein